MLLMFVCLSEQCNTETRLVEEKIPAFTAKTIKPEENKGGCVDFKQTNLGRGFKESKLKGSWGRESRTMSSLGRSASLAQSIRSGGTVLAGYRAAYRHCSG